MHGAIAIDVSHLSKSYDGHPAVRDISFQVYVGEIYGLLGSQRRRKKHDAAYADYPCSRLLPDVRQSLASTAYAMRIGSVD